MFDIYSCDSAISPFALFSFVLAIIIDTVLQYQLIFIVIFKENIFLLGSHFIFIFLLLLSSFQTSMFIERKMPPKCVDEQRFIKQYLQEFEVFKKKEVSVVFIIIFWVFKPLLSFVITFLMLLYNHPSPLNFQGIPDYVKTPVQAVVFLSKRDDKIEKQKVPHLPI